MTEIAAKPATRVKKISSDTAAAVSADVVKKPRAKKAVAASVEPVSDAPATVKKPRKVTAKRPAINAEERYKMVAAAAYFHAEKRGFAAGGAAADWQAAEAEIDAMLSQ
jgi:Protein of unknown function (DUF2934)